MKDLNGSPCTAGKLRQKAAVYHSFCLSKPVQMCVKSNQTCFPKASLKSTLGLTLASRWKSNLNFAFWKI